MNVKQLSMQQRRVGGFARKAADMAVNITESDIARRVAKVCSRLMIAMALITNTNAAIIGKVDLSGPMISLDG